MENVYFLSKFLENYNALFIFLDFFVFIPSLTEIPKYLNVLLFIPQSFLKITMHHYLKSTSFLDFFVF